MDKELAVHIAACPALAEKDQRPTQFKGVGPVLAATLLAYLPELGQMEDKQSPRSLAWLPIPKTAAPAGPIGKLMEEGVK